VTSETTGLAGRYASALYDLADEHEALDAVAADLSTLRGLIGESADLARLVRSPVIGREDQTKGIQAVLAAAGAHELTSKFVCTVAMNRRLFALDGMIKSFLAELARRRGEVTAEVASAVELDQAQIDAVAEALKDPIGSKISIDMTVDPSLIGGLVVRVGSRMIDSSIRTKLQRLQLAMKGVG
jgi:F-type H+-transporting ATPase subunit delta